MKRLLKISLIISIIMSCCADMGFAQEKLTRKQKNEIKRVAENENFTKTVQGDFRFTVFGIDTGFAPGLAGTQLKGGFFIFVQDGELSVLLPVGGPRMQDGNASSSREQLNYTVSKFTIVVSPTAEGGTKATINAKDPRLNTSCVFVLTLENNRTTLSSFVSGMDEVIYTGGLEVIK